MEQMFRLYRPDVIFHAAAYKHVPVMESHPSEAICNNVQGTRVVAELAEKYLADRFLLVSTDKAIRPTNVMGASKRIAEMYYNTLQNSKRNVDTEGNNLFTGWQALSEKQNSSQPGLAMCLLQMVL